MYRGKLEKSPAVKAFERECRRRRMREAAWSWLALAVVALGLFTAGVQVGMAHQRGLWAQPREAPCP